MEETWGGGADLMEDASIMLAIITHNRVQGRRG